MIISVINHTNGKLTDSEVQTALRVVNRQIAEDFEPYWSMGARLRLEGKSGRRPEPNEPADLRGDAVLYLWDQADVPGALGYHERNNRGVAYGFVFLELAQELGEPWTVTLSHEALEMIADPEVNLLVAGPHPGEPEREVFHWYEMCDAVQAETYEIDGIAVSNFVLPLYFTGGDEQGGRNDFLGRLHDRRTLPSFGINPGGYVGFFDPSKNDHDTYTLPGDRLARARQQVKYRAAAARRALRYQRSHAASAPGPAPAGRPARRAVEPAFEAFAIRVGGSRPGAGQEAVARDVAARVLGPGWKVERVARRPGAFEIVPEAGTLSAAEAWEATYRLRADRDVARAEPLFAGSLGDPDSEGQADRGRRADLLGGGHLPGTEDPEWSLGHIEARRAWALSRGEGVLIGHPDTGYLPHPEIWSQDPATRPVRADLGDFLGDTPTAEEVLEAGGFLEHPGHGTRTGSVIVSPAGPPPPGGSRDYVSGVAPAAQLVPLRISRSVILLSTRNLRRAIDYAVEAGCQVVSISMGGFGSGALHDAVRDAVDEGLIVLAAAGNNVGFVVWPAVYDEVIAVAASNVRRAPWNGSSLGPAVDITAPGESVWRASAVPENGSITWLVERGHGTSFAVAAAAGVAALWIAHHGWALLKQRFGKENVAAVFKEVLLTEGYARPDDWDTDNYGPGIIDAHRVLTAKLPATAPARRMRAVRSAAISEAHGDLETFAHLFPALPGDLVRPALIELLGATESTLPAQLAAVGEELALHLAFDPALRERFEAVARQVDLGARDGAPRARGAGLTAVDGLRERLAARGISPSLRGAWR